MNPTRAEFAAGIREATEQFDLQYDAKLGLALIEANCELYLWATKDLAILRKLSAVQINEVAASAAHPSC